MPINKFLSLFLLLAAIPTILYGATYSGRASLGTYLSDENFSKGMNGSQDNDYMFLSSRLYLKINGFQNSDKEILFDIRDKYDFFGKLDKENRLLTSEHNLHLRRVHFKTKTFHIGRINLKNVNSLYLDGAEYRIKLFSKNEVGFWGGFNPQNNRERRPEFDRDSVQFGSYLYYHPRDQINQKQFYTILGISEQQYRGVTDRRFIHQALLYELDQDRFISSFNLDLIPRVYFQNLYLSHYKKFNSNLSTHATIQAYDVIEYKRDRDIREQIPSSPYRVATLKIKLDRSFIKYAYGKRELDSLSRKRVELGHQLFSPHSPLNLLLKARYSDDFTKDISTLSYQLNYFQNNLEYSFDQQVSNEKYDNGKKLTPVISELSLAGYFNKSLYSSLSLQYAYDKEVSIITSLFNLTYRFSNRSLSRALEGIPTRENR